ncbi:hypothetical protein BGZ65_009457 [Modicella reniformis]|uniref:Uncharacterized protein n=1 Tax=Modicella reniformis TaxID=1440133 RepID=A0A9P6IT09_9FUNG|nr:hypothetical protein BGZ65_009457 [Modicella reniformis]
MKFLAAIVAAVAVAVVASAQQIQINNPTEGSIWNTGAQGYISWTGNCASQGLASHSVEIQLVNGPSSAVRFVADLGKLDCSGPTTSISIPVPNNVTSGSYSLRIQTSPQPSYSTSFQINNPASPVSTTGTPTTTGDVPTHTNQPSAGNALSASLVTLFSCAVAAFQFVL